MTSIPSDALRIHVVLPARRRWGWHDALVACLRAAHTVTISSAATAAPLPKMLGAWLAIESRLFGDVARLLDRGQPVPDPLPDACDLVIDLSEGSDGTYSAPMLRPTYDGSPDTLALVARVLRGECPMLTVEVDGVAVAGSFAAIEDRQVVGRGLMRSFARMVELLARTAAARGSPRAPLPVAPDHLPALFDATRLVGHAASLVRSKVTSRLRGGVVRPSHWNIATRWRSGGASVAGFAVEDYVAYPIDPETFYADPFVFADGDRTWLFVEAYPYATGRGVIAVAEVSEESGVGAFRTVLERPHHLSYPFVFREGDDVYLMPEASESRGLEIYRATSLPDGWTLDTRLFEGARLYDATLVERDGRWWLFATVASPGGSSWDELFAWHAPGFRGPWTAHAANPIKSDCRGARPAGRMIVAEGRLLRPAQVCERSYGEAVVWYDVTALTPEAFEEIAVATWQPATAARAGAIDGIHGVDLSTRFEAVDIRSDLSRGA